MRPVDQTTFGQPGGNCFSACVASLLGLPIEDVPYFMGEPVHLWSERLDLWLLPRGLYALHFEFPKLLVVRQRVMAEPERVWPAGYYILGGDSPRGSHAVVARRDLIVHDPHPDRAGLLRADGMAILVSMDLEGRR